jgi:N-acetylglucosaminyl-diphospho-decaprenol L-rhamnosyltransferase
MDEVRIQIINYKTKMFLVECLQTLFWSLAGTRLAYSVAILDNASGDDLSDLPQRFPGHSLELHPGKKNLGFGAGHNFLAAQGDAQYLLLLNPDTKILQLDTVQLLMRRAVESQAQIVGPRLITEGGTTQPWDHGELRGWIARLALSTGNSYWREHNELEPAAWVSGAAFFIAKSCFDDMGGFDENFFLYKEEEELCLRVRARGGNIIYDPTVSVYHHCGVVAKKTEHLRKSTDYFLQKHFRNRLGYSFFRLINQLLH